MIEAKSDKYENQVILSQAEVDRLLGNPAAKPAPKKLSPETEAKILILRERAKLVEKKMAESVKKSMAKKPAAKKSAATKSTSKKTAKTAVKKAAPKKAVAKKTAVKKPAKAVAKKPAKKVETLSVYFDGKLYGKARLAKKGDKKVVELVSIKK